MLTFDDITDIISGFIYKDLYPKLKPKTNGRRFFMSDSALKKILKNGIIKIPSNSIISPLAKDWIDFEGIKLIFED